MIYLIAWLEGVIGLSIELLFIRQLGPEAGGNYIATALVTAATLIGLTLGYLSGTRSTETPMSQISMNLIKVGGVATVTLSSLAISTTFMVMTNHMPRLAVLAVYTCFSCIPISYWLAQTFPLLLQEAHRRNSHHQSLPAKTMAVTTLGNVIGIGTISLGMVFVLGVPAALTSVILLSLLTALLCHTTGLRLATVCSLAVLAFPLNYLLPMITLDEANLYNDIYVVESSMQRQMIINNAVHSSIGYDGQPSEYIQHTQKALSELPDGAEVLVLGAGGFTLSEGAGVAHLIFTYVDIDPSLKALAEKKFLEKTINGSFIESDARHFLDTAAQSYDAILLDVFNSRFSVPATVLTVEAYHAIRDRLNEDGILIINRIAHQNLLDDYAKNSMATISSVFPVCYHERVQTDTEASSMVNIISTCSKTRAGLYRDPINRSELDYVRTGL
ncbi:fused MFS/spermidine synthase [Ferrimonas marina]|uniref:Spermine/spermidine synthase n=1 Tax=Ferrimonas marina TaxID=299255 RepID=A0A1M5TCW9_9GAMM|nr:fused MFS/spermidine synthase [Ferrimonas marina]SHH48665.1 Spermine/spermidine synthase [Ferrimonas marina]